LVDNGLHWRGRLFNKRDVLSKLFPLSIRPVEKPFCLQIFVLLALAGNALAAEKGAESVAKFVGMNSCSSSSCHGGSGEKSDECVIWSKKDFHSRAFATLTTARSERMAEVLGIESPVKNANCTICHAPFQTVPKKFQANPLDIKKGVSCESCHAPAQNWLRSHTRRDFTHADRVNAGMRDLENLYVRANTCVACHQNISTNLLAAGHPELIFELDGQAVSEPKHWSESANWNGAQAWLVGQAVALREMSWQLSKTPNDSKLREKWSGLLWLLGKIQQDENSASFDAAEIQKWSDNLARKMSEKEWSPQLTAKILDSLAETSGDFKSKNISQAIQARRAERLVLGLDRLVEASDQKLKSALDADLQKLFSLVQSLPDFDPAKFAEALENFSQKLQSSR
jgi:hypothetical protein